MLTVKDECGRDLVVGDRVAVDLDGGWVYCSTDCAEADATSDSESERKGGAS